MKLCDRQLKLDTINYRNKTKAGTYNYCSKCTGCYMGNSCIFSSPYRSIVEFEEVSGHRVLIKRGPGNRGPSECGTTHEATSGMSS